MQVITIGNLKGGVGKTTTTVNLADAMGRHGYRILVIDADPQGNCSSVLLKDIRKRETQSLVKALAGYARLSDLACRSTDARVDVVANHYECIRWENRYANTSDAFFAFYRLIKEDRALEKYDYLLVDTPPNIGPMLNNSLIVSNYVVVPVPVCDQFALDSLAIFLRMLQNTRDQNRKIKLLGILLTKHDESVPLYSLNRKRIIQFFARKGANVFPVPIRYDTTIEKAHMLHQTLFGLDPDSDSALDYEAVSRKIVEIVPPDRRAEEKGTLRGRSGLKMGNRIASAALSPT